MFVLNRAEYITEFTLRKKMKFSIKDFFGKCDRTHSFWRSWSHLFKKSLMENFIFAISRYLILPFFIP